MISQPLRELAEEAGILCQWNDAHDKLLNLDEDALRSVLGALGLPADSPEQADKSLRQLRRRKAAAESGPLLITDADQPIDLRGRLAAGSYCTIQREDGSRHEARVDSHGRLAAQPCGYHQLSCGEQQWTLACAPSRCPTVAELTGKGHIWGIAAQVYSLRRQNDGGLGDLGALQQLIGSAAALGADALAISPLHAMFSSLPDQYSPYSPSSRNHYNILHADPASLLGEAEMAQALRQCGLEEQATQLEQLDLIDWPAASALRLALLRHFHGRLAELPADLQQDFQQFRAQGGEALQLHCCHEALQRHMLDQGMGADWRKWPAPWQQPDTAEVRQFAAQHAGELDFHAFGQWLAARGLARAQELARESGMGIGLIADMAIGADPAGSFGWACQEQLLGRVSIGAPPDLLSRTGQNWGVAAFSPLGLQEHGYSAFIDMLRANLRHSGGLRIDHIMGLQRLWIIPEGESAGRGAYLSYPMDDLLRLLTLEAWRHRALIIGEDLGTVPAGLQEILGQRSILGMRVLQFEQQDSVLPPPRQWSAEALATTSTHDLPTTAGWLEGHDIHWRQQTDQIDAEDAAAARQQRTEEIRVLDSALQQEQLPAADDDERLASCLRYLGRTPAPLVLVPLEDVMASIEQPNMPGSDDRHPNWRRRWPDAAARMLEQPAPRERLKALDGERRDRNSQDD